MLQPRFYSDNLNIIRYFIVLQQNMRYLSEMDGIDRKICIAMQANAKLTAAELADTVGLPVSTANDRLRRLVASGVISGWHARLAPKAAGADLCAFLLIDMSHEGETAACDVLHASPEIMELHHISGAHSYLAKVRVQDMPTLQQFLTQTVKPLAAVQRTETILALDTLKETSEMMISSQDPTS